MLGIATRKAGSEIRCPKCGASQVVPSEEAAAAALAMSEFSKAPLVDENPSALVVYEDEPSAIEMPRKRPSDKSKASATASDTSATATAAATQPAAPAAATVPTGPATPEAPHPPGEPVPQGMILFPRRSYYIQATLFLVLAVAAFSSGYFIGRGDATLKLEDEQVAAARVMIEGNLFFNPGTGEIAFDENAVAIALPEGRIPDAEKKIPIRGIRPDDPRLADGENNKSIRMIRELGGAYARADDEGDFSMIVPEQGTYHVLIISANADRPRGVEVDELELLEMAEYFSLPAHLIGQSKYRWESKDFNIGTDPIEVDFGHNGKK
jgi:hypothetical protein